ncbi:hypothetical protein [Janthinobacterium fluminis]|uniref:Peptidase M50B-like n=1 Tax=Janthinobacterium fluminis TaxID=2987524 RepID=A0ABT5K819_9BURK|nr:hypothetical protein [Janthinobacterium fluminis]MDC8759897.1 hypothetical protein [Janthinobacterium fluminis]
MPAPTAMLSACTALAPAWVCQQREMLLYLAPSLLLALLIRALSARHPFFFLFTLAGTLCHELAHFGVGLLTLARPTAFTVVPRRVGQGWELGSVLLTRVRWYNAAPAALAPFLVLALPFWVAAWRTRPGWSFETLDLMLAFAVAPQFLACWPSAADWRIAARSWPCLLIAGLAGAALRHVRPELLPALWRF